MRTRTVLTLALTVGLLLGTGTPAALADHGGPGGWVDVDEDDSQIDVGATDEEETDGGGGGGDGDGPDCTWDRVPTPVIEDIWWEADPTLAEGLADPEDYDWYLVTCVDDSGNDFTDLVPVPVADDEPVDPTALRDEALDTLSLPVPTIAMNPAGDQVVHIETWLWIDDAMWQTHSKSVSAGAVTTTVTAEPARVTWDLGNGDTVVCDGPGVAYDATVSSGDQETDCSYTYAHTSAGQPGEAYEMTATVEWTVTWSVTGAAGGGALPALFTSAPVAVRVAEMQALNQ